MGSSIFLLYIIILNSQGDIIMKEKRLYHMKVYDSEIIDNLEKLLKYSEWIHYGEFYKKKEVKKAKENVKEMHGKISSHKLTFEDEWT